MTFVYTECKIAINGGDPLSGGHRVIIRVHDQGGGPYLGIRGENDAPETDEETEHDFFLCDEDDIDRFAAICKNMLRQANNPAPVAVISEQSGGVDTKLEVRL